MRFTKTAIDGAWLIDIEPLRDERGFFARTVCVEAFALSGLNGHMVQQSVSWNPRMGTVRGLHYQAAPHEEEKVVRVTRGGIFDVIVDLRKGSASYGRWFGAELTADSRRQIYVPKGVAHGFQTLEDDTEVHYEMTVPFHAEASRGIRWDDGSLAIPWPYPQLACEVGRISAKDMAWPLFSQLAHAP